METVEFKPNLPVKGIAFEFAEFLRVAQIETDKLGGRGERHSRRRDSGGFSNLSSFEETISAVKSPPEPTQIDVFHYDIKALATRADGKKRKYRRAPVGEYFSVGDVIQDNPVSSYQREIRKKIRRVKILVNIGIRWDINSETVYRRGIVVAALMQAIHESGIQCELYTVHSWNIKQEYFQWNMVRIPTRPFNYHLIHYILTNHSYQRRIGWSVAEILTRYREYGENGSIDLDKSQIPENALYLPRIEDNSEFRYPQEELKKLLDAACKRAV